MYSAAVMERGAVIATLLLLSCYQDVVLAGKCMNTCSLHGVLEYNQCMYIAVAIHVALWELVTALNLDYSAISEPLSGQSKVCLVYTRLPKENQIQQTG